MAKLQPETKFFIDMDGVLADFVESAVELVTGLQREIVMRGWPKGVHDMHVALKMGKDDFWHKIGEGGVHFWHRLRPYVWSMPMYKMLSELGSCIILSSPTRDPACAAGKMGWIQAHFAASASQTFREYVLAPAKQKQLLVGKHRILIDDNERNVRQWEAAGGRAVLVPQPWNHGEPVKQDDMALYLASLAKEEAVRLWD